MSWRVLHFPGALVLLRVAALALLACSLLQEAAPEGTGAWAPVELSVKLGPGGPVGSAGLTPAHVGAGTGASLPGEARGFSLKNMLKMSVDFCFWAIEMKVEFLWPACKVGRVV